ACRFETSSRGAASRSKMTAHAESGSRLWFASLMAIKSVYIPDPVVRDNIVSIRDEEHRHLSVSRAAVGEEIEIFDGRGNVMTAKISVLDRRETQARVTGNRHVPTDAHELILGLAMIRHAAFEFALEKAVEAGVTRIIPFLAARSNA